MALPSLLTLAFAVLLASVPTSPAATEAPREAGAEIAVVEVRDAPSSGVVALVTWDGSDVTQAGSTATAFVLNAGDSAQVAFNYTESPGTPAIDNATLSLQFAGVVLSSESIAATTVGRAGTASLNWTFGSLVYLTQGAYQLDAELLDRNDSVLYDQPFFVIVRAPFLLVSVILDMAIVLGIVEALWLRTVLRYRRRARRRYGAR